MEWIIYCLGLVDGVIDFSAIASVLVGVVALSLFVVKTCMQCDALHINISDFYKEAINSKIKLLTSAFTKIFTLFAVFLATALMVPNSKTIAAMYLIPKIAQNEQLNKIPEKALNLLNSKLDEWALDIVEEKGEK